MLSNRQQRKAEVAADNDKLQNNAFGQGSSGKMSSPKRRIETDVMKMCVAFFSWAKSTQANKKKQNRLMSDYEVTLVNDNMQEFYVRFKGPSETPFEGGLWKVHVELPDQYPYKSPSIGFVNRIFHPNIDELSGSVCLDVINQTWSPMFDMVNIFEVFLPQLLRYPNPTDPLNGEAAALLMRDQKSYDKKVKGLLDSDTFMFCCRACSAARRKQPMLTAFSPAEYVAKYANKEAAEEAGEDSDDEDEMSSVGSFKSEDE